MTPTENLPPKNSEEDVKIYLDYCKYLWDKIKMNQEAADRYFNYFLLFITTPVIFLATVVSKNTIFSKADITRILPPICLILFLIGFCFFMAFNNFRKYRIKYVLELLYIEENHIQKTLFNGLLSNLTKWDSVNAPLFSGVRADFYVSAVQMLTNSLWLTMFFFTSDYTATFAFLLLIFVGVFGFQWVIRHLVLHKYESIN